MKKLGLPLFVLVVLLVVIDSKELAKREYSSRQDDLRIGHHLKNNATNITRRANSTLDDMIYGFSMINLETIWKFGKDFTSFADFVNYLFDIEMELIHLRLKGLDLKNRVVYMCEFFQIMAEGKALPKNNKKNMWYIKTWSPEFMKRIEESTDLAFYFEQKVIDFAKFGVEMPKYINNKNDHVNFQIKIITENIKTYCDSLYIPCWDWLNPKKVAMDEKIKKLEDELKGVRHISTCYLDELRFFIHNMTNILHKKKVFFEKIGNLTSDFDENLNVYYENAQSDRKKYVDNTVCSILSSCQDLQCSKSKNEKSNGGLYGYFSDLFNPESTKYG